MKDSRLLWTGFVRSSEQFPDRSAISVAGREVTYAELGQQTKRLAATLQRELPKGGVPLTAVLAYRSETAYTSVLAALMTRVVVQPVRIAGGLRCYFG